MSAVVAPGAKLVTFYDRGRWCEGPVWSRALASLVFSDVRANRIARLDATGEVTPWRDPSGYANGNAFDRQGRLITCEHLGRRVVRQEGDGRLTVLADGFEGKPLNAPNDVVVASDGGIWFTDPTFGLELPEEGRQAVPQQRGRFVFRIDPAGSLEVMADTFEEPNGLAFSADETILYVSETSAALNPEGKREIRAFDVVGGRRLTGERLFARVPSGIPDGLKVDADGRVYAATDAGVRIWSRDGAPVGLIATPGTCGNLAFGGADGHRLFLCNGTHIHGISVKVQEAGWPR